VASVVLADDRREIEMTFTPMPAELKKTHPHLEEFWPFLQALNKESPRGKVLISTGFVEEQLKRVILAFMLDESTSRELFEGGNAPLGTLSSRISAAYALGLITHDEWHDLHLIRRIRNDFAHQVTTTFETPAVVSRCRELRSKAPDYPGVTVGSAGQFETAAVAIIVSLISRPHYVAKERRASKPWPS
jgi:hypothetical protein